ncbi:sensor histidine kinase [Streptomyces sp. NPDC002225]|uniref:sensor histidine kinase n=1 Tax=Streptomyces sp. NPDC002225 TaxID=3154413 RepID=UPI003332FEC8
MNSSTPYRVAAGLIYLSIGSLVGLLLAPLLVLSLLLRVASWLPLVAVPQAVVLCVRVVPTILRRRPGKEDHPGPPEAESPMREVLRLLPDRMAVLYKGLSFSLPLLRAVADLERLLARSVIADTGQTDAPIRPTAKTEPEEQPRAGWDDIRYIGLLLLGTVWLLPLASLAVPVVVFLVSLPLGPAEQLAFGPGNTLTVSSTVTRVAVALASVAVFTLLMGLLFWMGGLRARVVLRILSRLDEAETHRREEAAERQRIAALRVNDADYRRLERDLHDGAQARLAVLLMNLSLAKNRHGDDAAHLRAVVEETHEEIGKALDEIRSLVRGVQPPILSDRGLEAAVTALTERFHVPVEVISGLRRRPDVNVESTAYYIVAECLANTVKHASAPLIQVTLEEHDNHLAVSVTDNGTGGASLAGGTGLRGLGDRAAALNGWLDISSPPGGPTRVTVTLPWTPHPI